MVTELVPTALTADEARALTGEIRQRLDGLLPLIKRAFEGRADVALGYESWQAYCAAELNDVRVPLADRPAMVAELRAAGMSQRAIGSALGLSQPTVNRELRRATDSDESVGRPERITSLDGRERPATRPQAPAHFPEPETGAAAASTAAPVQHDDSWPPVTRPAVAEALDRFAPDADGPHREWRRNFLAAVNGAYRPISRSTAQEVADRADDECVAELARVAAELTSFADQVRSIRAANRPNNVLSLVRHA